MKRNFGIRIMMIAFSLTLLLSMISLPSLASAVDNQNQSSQLLSNAEIDKLSSEYHANPNDLRAAIQSELNSPVFSPWSAIKTNDGVTASSSQVTTKSGISPNYITQVYEYNQDSTAYVAPTSNYTKSGVHPALGMAAVHEYDWPYGAPYIPFGTILYWPTYVTIQGSGFNAFNVQDTGQAITKSAYWVDLYFGSNSTSNEDAALNYGDQIVTYYWYAF